MGVGVGPGCPVLLDDQANVVRGEPATQFSISGSTETNKSAGLGATISQVILAERERVFARAPAEWRGLWSAIWERLGEKWRTGMWRCWVASCFLRQDFPDIYQPWNPGEDPCATHADMGIPALQISGVESHALYADANNTHVGDAPRAGYRKAACGWRGDPVVFMGALEDPGAAQVGTTPKSGMPAQPRRHLPEPVSEGTAPKSRAPAPPVDPLVAPGRDEGRAYPASSSAREEPAGSRPAADEVRAAPASGDGPPPPVEEVRSRSPRREADSGGSRKESMALRSGRRVPRPRDRWTHMSRKGDERPRARESDDESEVEGILLLPPPRAGTPQQGLFRRRRSTDAPAVLLSASQVAKRRRTSSEGSARRRAPVTPDELRSS